MRNILARKKMTRAEIAGTIAAPVTATGLNYLAKRRGFTQENGRVDALAGLANSLAALAVSALIQ